MSNNSAKRNFLKVALFSLAIIACYTLIASFYSPTETIGFKDDLFVPTGSAGPGELARLGALLYNGKGACALCHEGAGARAPRLDFIAKDFSKRLKDPAYRGGAKDADSYIFESMTSPSAYVVKGYGVAGSNDAISPMPDVSKEPIGLKEEQMRAVVEYLKSRAGVESTTGKEQGK